MKKLFLITLCFMPMFAQANISQQTAVNDCTNELIQKKMADKKTAEKSCQCYVNTLMGITDKQKQQIDNWVKSGKSLESSPVYQKLSKRLLNCGNLR